MDTISLQTIKSITIEYSRSIETRMIGAVLVESKTVFRCEWDDIFFVFFIVNWQPKAAVSIGIELFVSSSFFHESSSGVEEFAETEEKDVFCDCR